MAEANDDTSLNELKVKGMAFEWNIKDFESLPQKPGESLKRSFCLGNESWEVVLYPKGYTPTTNHYYSSASAYVRLDVHRQTEDTKLQWILISVLLIIEGKVVAEFSGKNSSNGIYNYSFCLISVSKLLGCFCLAPNKTVKLVCSFCEVQSPNTKITVAAQTETIIDSINVLNEDIQKLHINNELCDVKIKVGPKEFLAHKAILAARSTVFSSMFKHDMIEKVDGVIDISDCDPESFEDFLKFIYSGKVENIEANYRKLYEIADKYCVNFLKNLCVDTMSEQLEVENICDVLELASVHNEAQLLKKATTFFIKNAECIIGTEQWNKFVVENTSLSSEILIKLVKKNTVN